MKQLLISLICLTTMQAIAQTPNWLWAKGAGGTGIDRATGVATDASGNVFVTGWFNSPSITFGSVTLTSAGVSADFIVKYDALGNVLWAKSIVDSTRVHDITTDASGNVFVAGYFYGNSISFGSFTLTGSVTSTDLFIVKYDGSGNVIWAKGAGGTDNDEVRSIATDASGNVVVTGKFKSPSITFGTTTLNNAGTTDNDIFVVKYDASGNIIWAKSAGGTAGDIVRSIATDASGNVLVAGDFGSSTITFGSTVLTNAGTPNQDIFIVKYDASGNLLWAKSAGGTSSEYGYSIATDLSGNVLLTGEFASPTITFGTTTLTKASAVTMFVVKYDASGNVLWAKSTGGNSHAGTGIVADASGNVLVAGWFTSSVIFGTTTLANAGFDDIFVVKYDASGNVVWAKSAGGASSDYPTDIALDASGNVPITGNFLSPSLAFGSTTLTYAGGSGSAHDIFLTKIGTATTGIEEFTADSDFKAYPNPVQDVLLLNTENKSIGAVQIYDCLGRKVLEKNITGKQAEIDISSWESGMYYLKAEQQTIRVMKR